MIPIAIGFCIDIVYFGKWLFAYVKRNNIPGSNFGVLTIFVLPAWGISGLMYFGKSPEQIQKVWNHFLVVLMLAFVVHIFICIGLPFLFMIGFNLYYGRKILDMSPLPSKKKEDSPAP
jgi:hypothetical protein